MRNELKFVVPQQHAPWVRANLCFHGLGREYEVRSLYFDRSFEFFRAKLDGLPLREKCRLRYYGEPDHPETKVRWETKFRRWQRVGKQQRWLGPSEAQELIRHPENHSQLLGCRPVVWVRYARSEFSAGGVRFTLDTGLEYSSFTTARRLTPLISVLEIKCQDEVRLDRYPWLQRLAPATAFSKYVHAVELLQLAGQ